jgi:hypothetical protein
MALMIGIVAEYVGLIYEEVKHRPNFIVGTTTRAEALRATGTEGT